eukprot:gene4105-5081_t
MSIAQYLNPSTRIEVQKGTTAFSRFHAVTARARLQKASETCWVGAQVGMSAVGLLLLTFFLLTSLLMSPACGLRCVQTDMLADVQYPALYTTGVYLLHALMVLVGLFGSPWPGEASKRLWTGDDWMLLVHLDSAHGLAYDWPAGIAVAAALVWQMWHPKTNGLEALQGNLLAFEATACRKRYLSASWTRADGPQ